ncbi:MAG: hypothetical protein D6816_10715 [Bacteroidetes bacterium]|nr:MAG: hypothetical protein D6816_10715 [Bacteroidota bacterium]
MSKQTSKSRRLWLVQLPDPVRKQYAADQLLLYASSRDQARAKYLTRVTSGRALNAQAVAAGVPTHQIVKRFASQVKVFAANYEWQTLPTDDYRQALKEATYTDPSGDRRTDDTALAFLLAQITPDSVYAPTRKLAVHRAARRGQTVVVDRGAPVVWIPHVGYKPIQL